MLRKIIFVSQQILVKVRRFYVATEYLCVATEFGLRQGSYVAIKNFYGMT